MREKLLDSCNRINDEQEKLNLLTTLQSKGLVTRDIMSFVVKQASIRTQNRWPDKLTARRAMSAKISDCYKALQWKRSHRKAIKNTCLDLLGGKKYKLNSLVKSVRREIYKENQTSTSRKKFIEKNNHLQKIQKNIWNSQTPKYKASTVPVRLKEYANLPIFKLPEDMPKPEELMDPFICHPGINLNQNELNILKKDPKYSLIDQCSKELFMVEMN